MLVSKTGIKCYSDSSLRLIPTNALKEIPDEEALCLANPEYSCVTCVDSECPDWGTRFASCPGHVSNTH